MTAAIQLACLFPPRVGYAGALTTMRDLTAYYRTGRSYPSRLEAVHLITLRNLSLGLAHGKGNRANRRAALLQAIREVAEASAWFDSKPSLTNAELEELARLDELKRRRFRTPHEL